MKLADFLKNPQGICAECGQHHVLTLKDRNFTCMACGTYQDRDLSAAKSIAKTGELDFYCGWNRRKG